MASLAQRMIGAAKLDAQTYEEVEADKTATGQAMLVVVLSSVAAGVAQANQGIAYLIGGVIGALIGWFIWAFITFIVGTKILPEAQTKSDMGELLRTIGFSASPGLLKVFGIIPGVGAIVAFIASLWMLAAMVIGVRQALDYTSTWRAVGVCLIGWVVYIVAIFVVLGVVFAAIGVAGGAAGG